MRTHLLAGLMAVAVIAGSGGCSGARTEYAPLRHPFRGATLNQDGDTTAAQWQRVHNATWLDPITRTPAARWLTGPDALGDLPDVVRHAKSAGALLVTVARRVSPTPRDSR